jgi:hypothetical protein
MPASDTWADQLIFPPWLHDSGRDGCLYNQAFYDAAARLANRGDRPASVLALHDRKVGQ